jgi:hypothetical protein
VVPFEKHKKFALEGKIQADIKIRAIPAGRSKMFVSVVDLKSAEIPK